MLTGQVCLAPLTKVNAKRAFRLASEKGLAYPEQLALLPETERSLSSAPTVHTQGFDHSSGRGMLPEVYKFNLAQVTELSEFKNAPFC
jgi:hypothetical protein